MTGGWNGGKSEHGLKVGDRVDCEDYNSHGPNEHMGKGTVTHVFGPYVWNDVKVMLDGDSHSTSAVAGCCKKVVQS